MAILVTGAGGFLGRHLVERLRRDGTAPVVALTRSPSPEPLNGIAECVADLSVPGWTDSLPGDIDCVVHLAQSNRYRQFPDGAPDMLGVNVVATAALLDWSRRRGVKRFVLASTGSVYRPVARLVTEDADTEPTSYYAASKLSAEHLARQYRDHFAVTVLRPFTIYGPGQKGMLFPHLIEKVASGQAVTVADGRGMCLTPLHVDDAVEFMLEMCRPGRPAVAGLFNMAGGTVVDLASIVRAIEVASGHDAIIRTTTEEVRWLAGDNSRLCTATGYRPRVDLEHGIRSLFHGG